MKGLSTRRSQAWLLAGVVAGTAAIVVVGRGAPTPVFAPLCVATFGAYAALVWSLRAPALRPRTLVVACVALMVVAIAVPARSSKDVYAYIMYGRIVAQHHASPYTHVPADYPSDPASARVQVAFRNTGSVYGPLFTAVSAAGMGVCGSSPACGRVFFQTLEALAVLACMLLVLRATKSWAAAACVGFNIILVASIVNGAHNDGLLALAVLAAVLFLRERPVLAGVLLGAAALIKLNVLLPAAVLVGWLLVRDDKRKALLAGGTTGVLVLVGYVLAGGAAALKPLHNTANFVSYHSFWYPVERLFAAIYDVGDRGAARAVAFDHHLALVALVIVVVLAVVVAAGRARTSGPAPVAIAALSVYVLAAPYILPWYTAMIVPLLALYRRSKTTWLILSYAALLYLLYPERFPVHRTFVTLILPEGARNLLPVVQVVFLCIVVAAAWRPRGTAEPADPRDSLDRISADVVNG